MKRLVAHLRSRMTDDEFQLYCEDVIIAATLFGLALLGWIYSL